MMRLADEVADRALAPSKVADAPSPPPPALPRGTEARVQLAMRKALPTRTVDAALRLPEQHLA